MAAYVVGERRLRWPQELIPLLDDPIDLIRQSARRSLIILSFLELNPEEAALIAAPVPGRPPTPLAHLKQPVDFGPAFGAAKAVRKSAMEKWTAWWAERDPKAKEPDPLATRSLRSELASLDPARLADALVEATPDQRKELVDKYRDAKGVAYTEALAAAIDRFPSAIRAELRDALADRMVRMTEATLRQYLDDTLSEIRRAAALGLAKRGSTAHVDRLADLLMDPNPVVERAAHTALCKLSTEDLGPAIDAKEDDRADAVARWKKWWKAKKSGPE